MFCAHPVRHAARRLSRWLLSAAAFTSAAAAHAGFATTHEAEVDAIYAQAAFGDTPIDIVFAAVQTIVRDDLRVIDSGDEIDALFSLAPSPQPSINLFFVDRLNVCGAATGYLGGCAESPGNLVIVDSAFTADPIYGANNLAHELAHNLGLPHVLPDDGSNLLNPTISTSFALTSAQVSALLGNPLVQVGPNGRFVTVTPIAVVPEPQAVALLLAGLGTAAMALLRKRQ